MNRTAYNQIKAINQSALKEVAKSPAHFLHYWQNGGREQTPQMAFGSAVHCLVLEPEKFDKRYGIFDDMQRPNTSKDYRDHENRLWKSKTIDSIEIEDKSVITLDDYRKAESMRDMIYSIPAIKELLEMPGEFESVHTWKDKEYGLPCKGICDKWIKDRRILLDLKTCNSAHPDKFTRSAFTYEYPLQAAFYVDGWEASRFYIIAVENTAPYAPLLVEMDKDIIEFGRARYRRYLRAIKECQQRGRFPSYEYWQPAGTYAMEVPAWAERMYN